MKIINGCALFEENEISVQKLKREEVWENYILQLSDEHKRLRAFQEELKKGKLIHD